MAEEQEEDENKRIRPREQALGQKYAFDYFFLKWNDSLTAPLDYFYLFDA